MTNKPQRFMITFRDPLTDKPCVKWFKNFVNARRYIRSLASNVPYSITLDDEYTFRGTYYVFSDVFIEMPKFGRVEIDGGTLDDKDI